MRTAFQNGKAFGSAYRSTMQKGQKYFQLNNAAEAKRRITDRLHGRLVVKALVVGRFHEHPDHQGVPINVNPTSVGRKSVNQLQRLVCQILRLTSRTVDGPVTGLIEQQRFAGRKREAEPSSPDLDSLKNSPMMKKLKTDHPGKE